MAAVVVARYTDEDSRSLVHDHSVDTQVEADLTSMQSEVRRALQERAEFPSIAQLDWVDYIEQTAVKLAREMEEDGGDLWHGADVFATRPGEEGLVSELRSQAAWCDQRRAEADALTADARGLRDRYLRNAAGITVENKDGAVLLRTATSEFQQHVAMEMDGGGVPETADVARVDMLQMLCLHL